MRNLVLAVLILLALTPARAEETCNLQRVAVIPFETDESGHIYIPAMLGTQKTRLMVDTGGFWSFIDKRLAESLNLKPKTMLDGWMVDASGAKLDKYVTVPELRLGNVIIGVPVDFVLGQAGESNEENGGTLGLNFFTRLDLEIDNAKKTIALFKQDHCTGAGVHWANEAVTLRMQAEKPRRGERGVPYQPIVSADLEGQAIRTLLDTGATRTYLDLDQAKRRFGIGPGSPGVEPAGKTHAISGKAIDVYSYTFKTLTVSGIKFENVSVYLGKFEKADLILGMHELKRLHLYFAFKDRMIHVTAADAGHSQ